MSVLNENTIIGASAASDYEIEQSLRFDDGSTSYLKRTPTAASNRRTWTFSAWVKRGSLPSNVQTIFMASNPSSAGAMIRFNADKLVLLGYNGGVSYSLATNRLFRDPSAWYHIVLAVDTTQGTAANRIKMYVNGVQETSFSTSTYPSQNLETYVNSTNPHYIGVTDESSLKLYFDGYIGEVNFIDGQALTPDSFGETGDYGEWKPTKYAGAYGTNGFYLPFEQDYSVEGFSTVVYEANTKVRYIGGTGFQPDFIWFKNRTRSSPHRLVDAVRGIPKTLSSNTTGAEATGLSDGTVNRLVTGLTADGFTLGIDDGGYRINSASGDDIVAWTWDMGGTAASNTSGTINSSVRANQAYGQSIVKYTGTGSNATVGHGLSYAPDMIICKSDTNGYDWPVYHSALASAAHVVTLNLTSAQEVQTNKFNGTAPTSSVFSVGTHGTNVSSKQQIAYCFNNVTGYSKFGTYTGSGSGNKAVATGFVPAFVMIKRKDGSGDWFIYDNVRQSQVGSNKKKILRANTTAVEDESSNYSLDFTSTGFTLQTNAAYLNGNNNTYIYAAFADTREYAYWLDQSGNNNDWNSEGGLTESDVMVDSPTNNFCTLNPLDMNIDNYAITVSEGNLQAAGPSEGRSLRSTMGMPSGKWYWEVCTTVSGVYNVAGIAKNSSPLNAVLGNDANGYTMFSQSGAKFNNGSTSSYGSAWNAAGNICGIAFDADNGTLVFYVNNSSQGTAFTGLTSGDFLPALAVRTGKAVVNFGQDSSFAGNKTPQGNSDANGIGDFYYQPPSGFLSLCTKSLPSVDVIPSEHFNTVIYTGNGADNRVLSGVGFTPDLGIFKRRNGTGPSQFFDTLRGATKQLRSDTTSAESTQSNKQKTFTSDGYTLGTDAQINGSGGTYVAWNWKAGGSASSNSNGTITSQVSANVDAGFSIVSYTGTGAIAATIGHGLASAPTMIIRKDRDTAVSWVVYHSSMGTGNGNLALFLNTTSAQDGGQGYMNNTAPTASVFTQGDQSFVGVSGRDYISYCFHDVDGYSKVGSYVGNGNVNGPMLHLGFKPKFVIIRRSTEVGVWFMFDTERSPHNVMNSKLNANGSDAEDSDTSWNIDFLSNGFKLRGNHVYINSQNNPHIFIAFAENPFKHTNAR